MAELLTLLAKEVRLYDCVREGTIVVGAHFYQAEEWNSLTGDVAKVPMVELQYARARIVPVPIGLASTHLHSYDYDVALGGEEFAATDEVRVIRPAPVEPCECGFDGAIATGP